MGIITINSNSMLEKAFEPIIFVCRKCGAERKGSEYATCGHDYSDYGVKGTNDPNKKNDTPIEVQKMP